MNFASFDFWSRLFWCVIVSSLFLVAARRMYPESERIVGKVCLLVTGLVLLASESWLTLGVFLWVVGAGWLAVRCFIARGSVERPIFAALILLQLLPLFYYKYWDFVLNEILGLGVRVPSVLIPMGLSFYTFQVIAFCVDTRKRNLPSPGFIDFLNFSIFFPQIIAGPIERRDHLLPQIERFRFRLDRGALDPALRWIVLGLFCKMALADNLGALMPRLKIDAGNAWHVWFECLVFGLRIYFDFAGYSFTAVGLGLLFGVKLTLNFRAPYWSTDLREFWRNWHITLSGWLRDYVYLPLGGRHRRWALNVLIVFLVSGIWHGAGWGFMIWGLLHGVGLIVCGIGKPLPLPTIVRGGVTFAFAIGSWLFFFERDSALMWEKAATMIRPRSYDPGSLKQLTTAFGSASDAVTFAFVLALAIVFLVVEGWDKRSGLDPYRSLRRTASAAAMVFMTILLAPGEESSFIYFNF